MRVPNWGEVTIFRRIGNCTRILRQLKCLYAETKLDYIKMLNAVPSEEMHNDCN